MRNYNNESMPYNGDMNDRKIADYLGEEFAQILKSKDAEAARHVFDTQLPAEVSEVLDARLSAHDFLVALKGSLVAFDREINTFKNATDVPVVDTIHSMDLLFDDYMTPQTTEASAENQTTRLSEMIESMDDDMLIRFMRHIANMNIDELSTANTIRDWIDNDVRNTVKEQLWEVYQDGREGTQVDVVQQRLHFIIEKNIEDIDKKIIGSMLR